MLQRKRSSTGTYMALKAITIKRCLKRQWPDKKAPLEFGGAFLIQVNRLYIHAKIAPPIKASTSP